MVHRTVITIAGLCSLWLFACNKATESGAGSSGFSAKIDGKNWEAMPISISATANAGVKGSFILVGSQSDGNRSQSITLTLYNVGGPGKYALGVGISGFGGSGHVGEGTGSGGDANTWMTPGNGVAGEVEITSASGGRIVGNFFFTAEASSKNNTIGGTRRVTEGRFDLPLAGTLAALEENAGSKVTAVMNGYAYNAETMEGSLADFTGGAGVRFSSITDSNALSLTLVGVTAPGTFTLSNTSPQRLITAGRNGGDAKHCCWGSMAADVGEITVTSLTSKRVKGTFSATLKPQNGKAAKEDLVITQGTFDIGIP